MASSRGHRLSWAQFRSVSIKALKPSARTMLCRHLNPRRDTFSSQGRVQDWRGLAEQYGRDALDIENIQMRPNVDFTEQILHRVTWDESATLGQLERYLSNMERYDILEDDALLRVILRDVEEYNRSEEMKRDEERRREEQMRRIQDPTVSGSHEAGAKKFSPITVEEAQTGEREYFDAFVCYAVEDQYFVKQMITHLEEKNGYKLCIIGRDLLPGTPEYDSIGELIEYRCKKMIVLLSNNYLKSPECDFQTKFAFSLLPNTVGKKIIPVKIEANVEMPAMLRCITPVDYTRSQTVDWFWKRLVSCLKGHSTEGTLRDSSARPESSLSLTVTRHSALISTTRSQRI